jgi:hypothetical protein
MSAKTALAAGAKTGPMGRYRTLQTKIARTTAGDL